MSHFAIPSHIISGTDVLSESAVYLKTMGNKAFIVTGKHVAVSEMMTKLLNMLDEIRITYKIFDGITGEPTDKMIEQELSFLKAQAVTSSSESAEEVLLIRQRQLPQCR